MEARGDYWHKLNPIYAGFDIYDALEAAAAYCPDLEGEDTLASAFMTMMRCYRQCPRRAKTAGMQLSSDGVSRMATRPASA